MTRYLPLLEQFDDWQATARAEHPGVIPCRTGCSACCHGPFDISVADAHLVAEAIAALPEAVRRPLIVRATAQLEQMGELATAFAEPWDVSILGEEEFDRLCEALAEEPCPCLDTTGACAIYPARPLVCRIMGLGLRTTEGGEIPNGCPIQEEFPEYAALPPKAFDLATWEREEEQALRGAAVSLFRDPERGGFETTVAGAVLLAARLPSPDRTPNPPDGEMP